MPDYLVTVTIRYADQPRSETEEDIRVYKITAPTPDDIEAPLRKFVLAEVKDEDRGVWTVDVASIVDFASADQGSLMTILGDITALISPIEPHWVAGRDHPDPANPSIVTREHWLIGPSGTLIKLPRRPTT